MAKFKGVHLECQECGSPFRVSQNRAATAKFCCKVCADKHRGDLLVKPKVQRFCPHCGGEFFAFPSQNHRRVYCSQLCAKNHPAALERRSAARIGAGNPQWRGGISPHVDGYLYESCAGHPFASGGRVLQHRLVMERHLCATNRRSKFLVRFGDNWYLRPNVVVHHINHDRRDNRVENLLCLTSSEHSTLHNALRLKQP